MDIVMEKHKILNVLKIKNEIHNCFVILIL